MRILIVCHRLPFPPDHGGKIRAFEMIRHLGAHHLVTVATLAHRREEVEQGNRLREYCDRLIVEVLPPAARWSRALAALASNKPSSARYFWSPRLRGAIHRAGRFDRILVHCAFMADYVLDLPCDRKVLDYADIDSGKWEDYRNYKGMPLSLAYGLEARKLRRYERNVGRAFNYCAVTTDHELAEFNQLDIPVGCSVIPNGVDLNYFGSVTQMESSSPTIVFVGRMNYFPNADGIVHFARNCFPLIRAAVPNAQLRIVGSDPAPSVLRLNSMPGIHVTGYVPDVRPYVADACVAIAPLRIARGTQNKVLEMMACGVPVVATSEVAKGVQAIPGEHILVANSESDFANQTVNLLRDRVLRQKISEAARHQVQTAHSWSAAMRKLDEILQLSNSKRFGERVPATTEPQPGQQQASPADSIARE